MVDDLLRFPRDDLRDACTSKSCEARTRSSRPIGRSMIARLTSEVEENNGAANDFG